MLEPAPALLEQQRDVGHRLLGLRLRRRRSPTDSRRVEVLADLAAQVDGVAGDHGLAEVVVERLLRVGVPGVELPDPRVARRCARCERHLAVLGFQDVVGQPGVAAHEVERAGEVEVVVDGEDVREGRRLREELERQPVPGVVGVEQVAREGEQPPPVLGARTAERVVLLEPRGRRWVLERARDRASRRSARRTARGRGGSSPAAASRRGLGP